MYSALMIDLKKSKEYSLKNREEIQRFILEVCSKLNQVLPGEKKMEFSAGDEIQGLFSSPAEAYLYFRLFAMLIHPVKIRAGIGVGSWDIKIHGEGTTAQDGQVYYRARRAINEADELEGYPILYYSDSKTDAVINSLIGGAAGIGERLSIYQNELMLLAELLFPLDAEGVLNSYHLFALKELVSYKREFKFYMEGRRADKRYPFDCCFDYGNISPVDVAEMEDSFYITSGRQRGLPSKLAYIMGISRQSVEKTLKTANIFVARNMAVSALKVMLEI